MEMQLQQGFGSPLANLGAIISSSPGLFARQARGAHSKKGSRPGSAGARRTEGTDVVHLRLEDVVERLKRGERLTPRDPVAAFDLGLAYKTLGRWAESADAFTRALEFLDHVEDKNRARNLATTYYMRGYAYASLATKQVGDEARLNFEKAENDYLEALKLKKDYMLVHCYLGVLYGTQSRWKEAERAFKKAIKLQPRYSGVYHDLGAIYMQSGRPRLALKAFEKAVEYEPKNLLSLRYLGEAYYEAERWEDARKILLRVLKLDPEDTSALHNLAGAYLHLDDLRKAEKTLRKALELDPADALAYSNLGFIYLKSGRPVESAGVFNKALDLDPNSETTKNSLRTLQSMMLIAVVDTYLDVLAEVGGLNVDDLVDDLAVTEAVLSAEGKYLWRTPTIYLPHELVYTLTPLVRRLDKDSRSLLAAKLFERGILSSGTASRLIGTDRIAFLMNLRNVGVTMTKIDPEELEGEALRADAEALTDSPAWKQFGDEARRRHQDPVSLLTKYMDERLEAWGDEVLDEQVSRDLQQSGYREEDAVEIVRQYRREKKDQRAAP